MGNSFSTWFKIGGEENSLRIQVSVMTLHCRHMDGQTILAEATRQPAKSLAENIHGQNWRKQRSTYQTSQFITSRTVCNLMKSYCLIQQKSYWKSYLYILLN